MVGICLHFFTFFKLKHNVRPQVCKSNLPYWKVNNLKWVLLIPYLIKREWRTSSNKGLSNMGGQYGNHVHLTLQISEQPSVKNLMVRGPSSPCFLHSLPLFFGFHVPSHRFLFISVPFSPSPQLTLPLFT